MAKKLTKKELKQLEEVAKAKRDLRDTFISQYGNFQADVNALERVYKMDRVANNDKLSKGRLTDEEVIKVRDRYNLLVEVDNDKKTKGEEARVDYVVSMILRSEKCNDAGNYNINNATHILRDDLIIDEIIWTDDEVCYILEMMNKFNYTRIIFMDNSTAATETLARFVKRGCKVTGYVEKTDIRYNFKSEKYERVVDKTGLVIELPQE